FRSGGQGGAARVEEVGVLLQRGGAEPVGQGGDRGRQRRQIGRRQIGRIGSRRTGERGRRRAVGRGPRDGRGRWRAATDAGAGEQGRDVETGAAAFDRFGAGPPIHVTTLVPGHGVRRIGVGRR